MLSDEELLLRNRRQQEIIAGFAERMQLPLRPPPRPLPGSAAINRKPFDAELFAEPPEEDDRARINVYASTTAVEIGSARLALNSLGGLVTEAAAAPPDAPMGYQPTEAQLTAAQKVNAEQDARAAAAEALPEETKRQRYKVFSDFGTNEEADDGDWKLAGGPQLEEMVQKMDLIDLRYVVPLIEAGGVMPRWQDLPKSARITVHNLWRLNTMMDLMDFGIPLLAVLVLSYPWRASPRKSQTHATS